MISMEDCIAFCGLTEDEVLAIAEHEHVPEMAATAIGEHLLGQKHGAETIRNMMIDDIRLALGRDDRAHADELRMTLSRFLDVHPEAGKAAEVRSL